MLFINQLFEWHSLEAANPQIDRVLWIAPSGIDAVTIDINHPHAQPIWHKYQNLLAAFAESQISPVQNDPYAVIQLHNEEISLAQRQLLHKAWAAIAPIIATGELVFHRSGRGRLIAQAVQRTGRSEATIRKDLRRYWQGGQTLNALLPRFDLCGGKGKVRSSQDSKRGRPTLLCLPTGESVGINVDAEVREKLLTGCRLFYENRTGRTLKQAYQLTLEKFFHRGYAIEQGVLVPILPPAEELPSFTQFKYWYEKSRSLSKTLIAREGQRRFNLRHRSLGGDSTAMAFGPGSLYQIDATIADIYLVSSLNRNWIIGRPTLYLVIDVFSRLIVGFVVTLESASWLGAMLALENATADKVEFCRFNGIEIQETEWPSHHLPEAILADRGELEGYNANNLVESLGVQVCNTPPYRADLKGIIERSFRYFNDEIIHWLPGSFSKVKERGERDYRLDGVLTLHEFRQLMILFILDHNNEKRLDEYHFEEFMIQENVVPYPVNLWHWGVENRVGSLHWKPPQTIRLNLLPSELASVTRNGIYFKKLHYTCELAFKEQWFVLARNSGGWKIPVAYDPRRVDNIYLRLDRGQRMEVCNLHETEQRFQGLDFLTVADYYRRFEQDKQAARTRGLQSQASLNAKANQIIASASAIAQEQRDSQSQPNRLKNIRLNKHSERLKERQELAWQLDSQTVTSPSNSVFPIQPTNQVDEQMDEYVPPARPIEKLRAVRERTLNHEKDSNP